MGNSQGWLGALISGGFAAAQQGAQMAYDASQAKKNREFQAEEAEKNRAYQTEEANVNRIFQSNEAALQRDWSSQEAERAMDWQEEMYSKYNSLSGKIAQAEQAGVNPMLAITGNAVSPMSASASAPSGASASGSQAGSVGTPSGDSASMAFVDIIGKVLGFKQLQAETDLMQSEAERNRADAERIGKETSWIDRLSEAELNHMVASQSELESRLGLNDAQANKLGAEFSKLVQEASRISQITDAEKRKIEAEAELARWTADNREWLLALEAGTSVLGSVTQIATQVMENKTKLILGGKK